MIEKLIFQFCYFRDECEAIGELAGVEGTDVFCHRQCMVYPYDNCPEDKCRCTTFAPKAVKLYGIRQAGNNIFWLGLFWNPRLLETR